MKINKQLQTYIVFFITGKVSLVEQFKWVDTFRNSLVSGKGEFPSKVYIKLLLSISLHSTELLNYYIITT